ncbi:HprK-related kinase A [Vibrio alfacsensis]|uniref:HprK-related kinase A n=1 Tax=Vibrio alfacsensis TaxID=1074311 RepID=UPI004067C659
MFLTNRIYLLQVGDFIFQIESNVSAIHDYLYTHYRTNLKQPTSNTYIDYYIAIKHGSWFRRFFKPQVTFYFNYLAPFKPLPLSQAHALLEWGMNWVLSTQAHQHLIIHAASLEKNGKGVILSAPSGSGKSTLCAYLVSQGWRLLSDELALVHTETLTMHSLARPISLKNQSIDVIRPYFDDDHFSDIAVDTHKGTVCLVKPPLPSSIRAQETAKPELIVFVNFNQDETLYIESVEPAVALTEVIQNSFNFGLLNQNGFLCAKQLINNCDTIYVEYSNLQTCEQTLSHYIDEGSRCEQAS